MAFLLGFPFSCASRTTGAACHGNAARAACVTGNVPHRMSCGAISHSTCSPERRDPLRRPHSQAAEKEEEALNDGADPEEAAAQAQAEMEKMEKEEGERGREGGEGCSGADGTQEAEEEAVKSWKEREEEEVRGREGCMSASSHTHCV